MLCELNLSFIFIVLIKAQEPTINATLNEQLPTTTNIDILNLNKWFDGHMKLSALLLVGLVLIQLMLFARKGLLYNKVTKKQYLLILSWATILTFTSISTFILFLLVPKIVILIFGITQIILLLRMVQLLDSVRKIKPVRNIIRRRSSSNAHRIINLPLNATMTIVANATNAATDIFQSIPNAMSKNTHESPSRNTPYHDPDMMSTRNFMDLSQIEFPDFKKVSFTRHIRNPM